jgi:hypothetical protein
VLDDLHQLGKRWNHMSFSLNSISNNLEKDFYNSEKENLHACIHIPTLVMACAGHWLSD